MGYLFMAKLYHWVQFFWKIILLGPNFWENYTIGSEFLGLLYHCVQIFKVVYDWVLNLHFNSVFIYCIGTLL